MNKLQNGINVFIPQAIAAQPLGIASKIILAQIDKDPDITNDRLAEMVGVTSRGVKKILTRLRSGGFIAATGKGRARRLHLQFHVEQGTECPVSEIIVSIPKRELRAPPQEMSSLRVELSLADDFEQTLRSIDEMTRNRRFFPETPMRMIEALIRRVALEMDAIPEKAKILDELHTRRNAFFAVSATYKLPKAMRREIAGKIANATPEQLAAFHDRCQAAQMEHKNTLLLAAHFLDEASSGVVEIGGEPAPVNAVQLPQDEALGVVDGLVGPAAPAR